MVHVVWTDTGRASGGTEVGNEVRLTVVTVKGRLQPDSTTAFRPGPGRASDCDDSETDSVTASAWQGWHPIHRHRSSLRRPVDLDQARIHSPLTTVKQDLLLLGYSRPLASVPSGHRLVRVVSAGRSHLLMRRCGWVARTWRAAAARPRLVSLSRERE